MKKLQFYPHIRGGICFSTLLAAALIFIFSGCKNPSSDSWEEPVHDYFEKYTNTAAIEKHEMGIASAKDKFGASCIPSDGDQTVTFYLRNPRNYTLDMTFNGPEGCVGPIQDTEDKSVVRITYPQSVLFENEAGGSIGGTITVKEHETQREFDPYSFSLKCNTPPPSVAGQAVLVSPSNSQNYFVCFYLPSELSGQSHSLDTHTLCIEGPNGQTFGPGTLSDLAAASAVPPNDLAPLPSGGNFTGTSPNGDPAFYYNTGRAMQANENLSWKIYLRDNDGLTSRKMTASTIVREAHMTVSGETLLTTTADENTTILTAIVDEGTVNTWFWESNDNTVVTVNSNSNRATITAIGGGETTINITATLLDGRIVQSTKTIRVLDLTFDSSSPQDFIKGQANVALTVNKPAFANLSWASTDTNIASVNTSGQVTAVAKGSTTITATASYGGKSVTKTQNIYVHEVTVSQDGGSNRHELFVGSDDTIVYTASISPPEGRPAPTGITYIWQNINDSVVTMTASGNSRTFKASTTTAGSSTIYCRAKLNDVQTIVMTTGITVYKHAVSITPPTSVNSQNSETTPSALYALTNLNDTFSLSVTTASSFPAGTSFSWQIQRGAYAGPDIPGSTATVKPSDVNSSTATNKRAPDRWMIISTVTLPSGYTSTNAYNIYVYHLTIPNIAISQRIKPTDLDLDSSGKYYVGSNDSDKTFTLKAQGPSMPDGVTYKWYVGSRQIGTGQEIEPTIATIRNSSALLTSNASVTIRCEASITGCETKSATTTIDFLKPKTFASTAATIAETYTFTYVPSPNGDALLYQRDWNETFTYSLGSGFPANCEYRWVWGSKSWSNWSTTATSYTVSIRELWGGDSDPSTDVGRTTWTIYCNIRAPGYKEQIVEFDISFTYDGRPEYQP